MKEVTKNVRENQYSTKLKKTYYIIIDKILSA